MSFARLPRFRRVADTPRIRLTDRDKQIIRHVHKHRFLRSSHIVSLIGQSRQRILRRLQLLYHQGYLERPRAQIDYYHFGGSQQIVYGLGNKGVALIKRELNLAYHEVDWSRKNRTAGRIFLEHALMVSDIMVAIEVACRESGKIRLLTGREIPLPSETVRKRDPFRWNVILNRGVKVSLIPDRVFALESLDQSSGRNLAYYFLEADRGTMPVARKSLSQTSIYRKLLAYQATWAQSVHRKLFGFHRFRVLAVTTDFNRAKNFGIACQNLQSGHGLFVFANQGNLKEVTTLCGIA